MILAGYTISLSIFKIILNTLAIIFYYSILRAISTIFILCTRAAFIMAFFLYLEFNKIK